MTSILDLKKEEVLEFIILHGCITEKEIKDIARWTNEDGIFELGGHNFKKIADHFGCKEEDVKVFLRCLRLFDDNGNVVDIPDWALKVKDDLEKKYFGGKVAEKVAMQCAKYFWENLEEIQKPKKKLPPPAVNDDCLKWEPTEEEYAEAVRILKGVENENTK